MKKALITASFMVAAVLLIMLFGFNLPKTELEPMLAPVLLLTEDDTGAFLLQLRLGAQAALNDIGCELTAEVVRQNDFSLKDASDTYSGALVYIQNDSRRRAVLDALDETFLPVAVIDGCGDRHASVCQDQSQLGQCAADLAANALQVCIYGGSETARRAAMEILDRRWVSEEDFDPLNPQNAALALDFPAAQKTLSAKSLYHWQCALYSVSPGGNCAKPLEEGVVQALILESPYAMGYRAAEALWTSPEAHRLPYYTVSRETMYDAQNVKLIFPLLN